MLSAYWALSVPCAWWNAILCEMPFPTAVSCATFYAQLQGSLAGTPMGPQKALSSPFTHLAPTSADLHLHVTPDPSSTEREEKLGQGRICTCQEAMRILTKQADRAVCRSKRPGRNPRACSLWGIHFRSKPQLLHLQTKTVTPISQTELQGDEWAHRHEALLTVSGSGWTLNTVAQAQCPPHYTLRKTDVMTNTQTIFMARKLGSSLKQ
jgi:hypothetical protein